MAALEKLWVVGSEGSGMGGPLPSLAILGTMVVLSILGLLALACWVCVWNKTRPIRDHGGLTNPFTVDQSCRKASVTAAYRSGRHLK